MNIFKAVLFAGMVLASQATAQTFVRFHSGVNLSVVPGGSDRSAAPLDVQEATSAQRVAEAADIGFDFIRLRVSLAPWTDTGSTALPNAILATRCSSAWFLCRKTVHLETTEENSIRRLT